MEETPWAAPAQEKYLVSGETGQQFDARALRDRIRSGDLTPEHEISVVGTDVWTPAGQVPALSRYFSLITQKAGVTASPLVHVSTVVAPPARSRYFAGIVYPFTSITAVAILLLGFATALVPLLSIAVSLVGSVFMLAIIRRSGDGETRAPELNAVGGILDWFLDVLRFIAVALISAWPFTVFLFVRTVPVFFGAAIVMLLYYPACVVAVARWRKVSMALSIKEIFGLMSVLGVSYIVAVVLLVGLSFGSTLLTVPAALTIGLRFARGLEVVMRLFTAFYVAHLLGWAVYRHRDQLE